MLNAFLKDGPAGLNAFDPIAVVPSIVFPPLKSELQNEALLTAALDQVAYGLALVHIDTRQIRFANGLARESLQAPGNESTGLCNTLGHLATVQRCHSAQLDRALQRAKVGVRGLVSLGAEGAAPSVAVVPLATPTANGHALLVFSKRQLCDSSTVALFARERGLTGAEGNVLAAVCTGLRPREIAERHGVQISTVRSQLRSIRLKTRCETIRQLVETISVLPPTTRHLGAGA
jgi:DNA-binding CsgD family transcriptional regulator